MLRIRKRGRRENEGSVGAKKCEAAVQTVSKKRGDVNDDVAFRACVHSTEILGQTRMLISLVSCTVWIAHDFV